MVCQLCASSEEYFANLPSPSVALVLEAYTWVRNQRDADMCLQDLILPPMKWTDFDGSLSGREKSQQRNGKQGAALNDHSRLCRGLMTIPGVVGTDRNLEDRVHLAQL